MKCSYEFFFIRNLKTNLKISDPDVLFVAAGEQDSVPSFRGRKRTNPTTAQTASAARQRTKVRSFLSSIQRLEKKIFKTLILFGTKNPLEIGSDNWFQNLRQTDAF